MRDDDMAFLDYLSVEQLRGKIEGAELDIEEAQAVIAACKTRLGE